MSSPAFAAGLTPTEQAARVAAVVLNKVQNLEWTYFQVQLSEQFEIDLSEQRPNMQLLARIEERPVDDRNRRYKWVGTLDERNQLLSCVLSALRANPEAGREVFRRIFDINEIPDPGVDKGVVGFVNWLMRSYRNRIYRKRVRAGGESIAIVAEGDSWFQYPWVTDVVSHLYRNRKYRVFNLAAGGDWLSTILKAGQYVSELSRIQPDVLLVSAGGNDLTADGRVSYTVQRPAAELEKCFNVLLRKRLQQEANRPTNRGGRSLFDPAKYELGVRCLTPEFVALLNFVQLQYLLLLQNLSQRKLKDVAVVTHGYDFTRPHTNFLRVTTPFRNLVNWWLGGRWLWVPMAEKGLNEAQKRAVGYVMVWEFNEVLIDLALNSGHPKLFHVDCRGLTKRDEDWFDEIHLTSASYQKVAELFQSCIQHVTGTSEEQLADHSRIFNVSDGRGGTIHHGTAECEESLREGNAQVSTQWRSRHGANT